MAVIDHGRVIVEGTSSELKSSIGGNALSLQLANAAQRAEAATLIASLCGDGILPATDPAVIAVTVADASAAADVLSALSRANIQLAPFFARRAEPGRRVLRGDRTPGGEPTCGH